MSKQVTKNDLEAIVKRINLITKSPLDSWTKTSDGKFKSNVGNYHLDWAYGGVTLHRMDNESGGINDVIRCGYVSKKELQKLMFAYIAGVQEVQS